MEQPQTIEIGLVLYPGAPQVAVLGLTDLFCVANRMASSRLQKSEPPLRVTHWQQSTADAGPERIFDSGSNAPSVLTALILPPSLSEPVDDRPVWSIVYFLVPTEFRHRGVAHGLLRGAVGFAREWRVEVLEAYPVDKSARGDDAWLWNGTMSMYRKAGFVEIARRRPDRPVVRLWLRRE